MQTLNRRVLLKSATAGGVAFPLLLLNQQARGQAMPSARQRLETFVAAPGRLASLRKGVQVMKARPPSDPKSWFYQAAIHAVSDEAVAIAQQIDPAVASVDRAKFWNQCPHSDSANSADFLIWHRAYIYYFERILREASGDPNLSLPYWNYTEPMQRQFPRSFGLAERDLQTGVPQNPLYDDRREMAFMAGLYDLSERAVSTAVIYGEQNFFGESEITGLAGGVGDNDSTTRGLIERQPHDVIHFACGGAIGNPDPSTGATVGLMSDVATAASDPIFWVHHANIDRLWTTWECLTPARLWGQVPPKDWLDAKPWHFNDIGGTVVNQPRSFYIDRRNLPVSYDSDQVSCSPLSAKPFPTPTPPSGPATPLALNPTIKSFAFKAEAGVREGTGRVKPNAVYAVDVPLKTLSGALGGTAKKAILNAASTAPRRTILEIAELKVEGVTSVGFDVYVNLPVGTKPNPDSPYFVGTVALFGLTGGGNGHAHHHQNQGKQRFDISRAMISASFDPSRARVSIVPFDILTPRIGQARLIRPAGLTHGQMRIVILEGSSAPVM